MEDNDHVLCVPRNREEWRAYNAIRRKVLLENRGKLGVYITQTVAVIHDLTNNSTNERFEEE